MLSGARTGLLTTFLGGLPGQAAARLATAVEVDRLMDGASLPHDDILAGLRPVLRRDHPGRTLTPMRAFCQPFQDLLCSTARKDKQKASIARGSLMPVWNWVSRVLILREAGLYFREFRGLAAAQRTDAAMARAAQFWPLAAGAITRALADDAGRAAALEILGDEATLADAREMALLLGAGPGIQKLQAMLPAPVASLTETLLWDVRAVYDTLAASQPDVAPYVAVITMNRLARPWEALRLPMLVTRHADEALISKTDMGLVGEILFARMDALKASIQATRHPLFDADILMEQVRSFAELSRHIVKEIELKRDSEWGKRLLGERALIGEVMDGFMDRALKEVAAALPTQKGTGADFSRAPAAEKRGMALRYARLVAGSRDFAAAASFGARQKTAYEDLCTLLRRYNEDVVKELKSANPTRAVVADAQLELCAELTAVLFSDAEANLLRRRARAAKAP